MDDMTPTELAREISKSIGDIHAEMIRVRGAGLPSKYLGALSAMDDKLTRLADLNAALGESVRKSETPAAPASTDGKAPTQKTV